MKLKQMSIYTNFITFFSYHYEIKLKTNRFTNIVI